MLNKKPLFIPLKKEYFEAFEAGTKTKEYRVYGLRWNERTCTPGREVTLSCGYRKHRRLTGRVKSFESVNPYDSAGTVALSKCVGTFYRNVAEIEIAIIKN